MRSPDDFDTRPMAKNTCEEYPRLSIFRLKEWGYLDVPHTKAKISWENIWGRKDAIRLDIDLDPCIPSVHISTRSGKNDLSYYVQLASDCCRFGGKRYWFVCPLSIAGRYCGRRCAVLYSAGSYLGCRKCYDLAYSIQQISYSRMFSGSLEFTALDEKICEKLRGMRVKFWHGRLTKKHSSLLRKMNRLGVSYDQESLENAARKSWKRSLRGKGRVI